ncbi:MAG TPA: 4Fe-4S dicluster domain-containing protein [bacterium]|nr:4Fe-4S dicluster domain-containing protein [bacterium]
MELKIAIASGKGGTGKTFVATNIAVVLERMGHPVRYLDCDVEAPNGHLFLKPETGPAEPVTLLSPAQVDLDRCTACGRCVEACQYHALTLIREKVLLFRNLCHVCGACTLVCPTGAIREGEREIGKLIHGRRGPMEVHYGLLETGEGGMAPRLIRRVKRHAGEGINLLDSPPGTACPAVETVKDADLCVLITDPTPFGIHDLKLAAAMCRALGREPVVLVNRADDVNRDLKIYCKEARLEIIGEIPDDRKIAESYSSGDLAVETLPEYGSLFHNLAERLIRRAQNPERVRVPHNGNAISVLPNSGPGETLRKESPRAPRTKELVVISGKGGTGKTSLAAAFCALEGKIAIADCDVDAADLHLILNPARRAGGQFSGGNQAVIDPDRCTGCGACADHCRFEAVRPVAGQDKTVYAIEESSCEGCGVCAIVCPEQAVRLTPAVNGEWIVSDTRFGPMSHARLGVAGENSGKLVTLVRENKNFIAKQSGLDRALIDGSPGTGCPVIASLTGADYALVVTEPTVSGIHDLRRVLDVILFFRIPSGVLVNKSDINPEKADAVRHIAEEAGSDFLGMIPYDRRMTAAQVEGLSIVEYTDGPITDTIRTIWDKVRARCFETKE